MSNLPRTWLLFYHPVFIDSTRRLRNTQEIQSCTVAFSPPIPYNKKISGNRIRLPTRLEKERKNAMKIIHTPSLSQEQTKDIHAITGLCRQTDGTVLSCPEDGDHFWLLYGDGNRMDAFFAAYQMDGSSWECSAFTRPDCRNQGHFHALLEQVCRDSQEEGEPDLCFVTDNRCPDTLKTLRHLDAEFLYDEYMMEADLSQARGGLRLQDLDSLCSVTAEPITEDGEMSLAMWISSGLDSSLGGSSESDSSLGISSGLNSSLGISTGLNSSLGISANQVSSDRTSPAPAKPCPAPHPDRDSLPAGACRIAVHGTGAYLYGLEILPQHRQKGLGTWFLYHIMSMLAGQGCQCLRLQVSGTNAPALGLYRKTGFRITETLSYFLY